MRNLKKNLRAKITHVTAGMNVGAQKQLKSCYQLKLKLLKGRLFFVNFDASLDPPLTDIFLVWKDSFRYSNFYKIHSRIFNSIS